MPTDAGSGIASTVYQLDGGTAHTYSGPFTVTGSGTHTVTCHSTDHAGNVEATRTATVTIIVTTLSPNLTSGAVGRA